MKRRTTDQAYKDGYALGREHAAQEYASRLRTAELRAEQLKLMGAVAELVKAASHAVNGLAQTFDSGPRI